MRDFEFQNSTKIVFGKDRVSEVGKAVRSFGDKVLLVTGRRSLKKTGLYEKVLEYLEAKSLVVHDLEGIRSNPVLSKVRKGIDIVRRHNIPVLLAVGGGSVMDTAKAIAAGAMMKKGDVWDFFVWKSEIKNALPVITVPTIAASGSEMNGFMVITDEATRHKLAVGSPCLYPRISILDPTVTFSVPPDYTAYGGVDAVCHLFEPYFNAPDPFTPLQDRMAEGLMRTIMDATDICLKRPSAYEGRATMMWGASLALCGLTRAGVGDVRFPVHMIEHALSALFSLAHGAGLAALLPGWMRWRTEQGHPEKIAQMGERLWHLPAGQDLKEKATAAITAFETWLYQIKCPKRLSDLGIRPGDHEELAENASFQCKIWGMDQIYPLEIIKDVLHYCQ